jgi:hypothetical protein
VRRFLPHLMDLAPKRKIEPGKVFECYRAMDGAPRDQAMLWLCSMDWFGAGAARRGLAAVRPVTFNARGTERKPCALLTINGQYRRLKSCRVQISG